MDNMNDGINPATEKQQHLTDPTYRAWLTQCQAETPLADYDSLEEFAADEEVPGGPTFYTLHQAGETPLDAVKIILRSQGLDVA